MTLRVLAATAAAAGVAACGGGGGAAGGGGAPPMVPAVQPQTTVIGRVTDCLWPSGPSTGVMLCAPGAPVAGATVVLSTALIAGPGLPSVLPPNTATATTALDGGYTLAGATPGAAHVAVFPAMGDPHVALHAHLGLSYNGAIRFPIPMAGSTSSFDFSLTTPTAAESTWLVALNADRASVGAPPVAFDEWNVEAARNWVTVMASTPFYGDPPDPFVAPQAATPADLYAARGGDWWLDGRVISAGGPVHGSTVLDGELAFEQEKNTSPPGPHWQALIDPRYAWVGLASYRCQATGHGCDANSIAYTELFGVPR